MQPYLVPAADLLSVQSDKSLYGIQQRGADKTPLEPDQRRQSFQLRGRNLL